MEDEKYVCTCKFGYQQGVDVEAKRGDELILIEVKGAKVNKLEAQKKSKIFSANQIKTHLAVAILKALNMKKENLDADVGIAHPNTKEIRELVDPIISFLKMLSIKHYWVSSDGNILII